jgi:hypothetical protein
MRVDERGLYFEADLNPNVQASRDLYALVERGDITQMSFGFTIGDEDIDDRGDTVRAHITRIEQLFELSAVTFPAYAQTSVMAVPDEFAYGPGMDDDDDDDDDVDLDDMLEMNGRSWDVDVAAARRRREANG